MTHGRTHYDVLGITPKAPQEIVGAVYRAWMQALRIHPDLGGDEETAKAINAAYETLKDPERRAAYDARITHEAASPADEVRRRAPRVAIDVPIAFCIPPDGRWIPAQALDASSLGLKLRTTEDLAIGMHVAVAFTGSAAPAAEAVIRWTKALAAGGAWRHEAGVEFFHPVPDILRRLGL
jgi:hypothetical protein